MKLSKYVGVYMMSFAAMPNAIAACSIIGKFTTNHDELITINGNLSGTATSDHKCFYEHPVAAQEATAGLGVVFHIDEYVNPSCPQDHFAYDDLSFETCQYASGTATQPDDGGVGSIWWERTGAVASVVPAPTIIENDVKVNSAVASASGQSGAIPLHSDLDILVADEGVPVVGQVLLLKTDKAPGTETIEQPGPTDDAGTTSAGIDHTVKSTSTSYVMSTTADAQTPEEIPITWLPAEYEAQFRTTCYVTVIQSEWTSGAMTYNLSGLDSSIGFPYSFVKMVKRKGSGLLNDGVTFLQYTQINHQDHWYEQTSGCPYTASKTCAVDGYTIASPTDYIPKGSTIQIDDVGQLIAQDTGGDITDYRADIYFGYRYSDCAAYGKDHQNTLHLVSY